jgi:DNA-binding NtrC family response regulator
MGRAYRRPKRLTPAAETVLLGHAWPGNVRELANLLERVVLLHDAEDIGADALGLAAAPARPSGVAVDADDVRVDFSRGGLNLLRLERRLIVEALEAARGNRRRAAELLGISTETLRYRMEKHGLAGGAKERASG